MGLRDRSRSIALVLLAGGVLSFVLQHPSGAWRDVAVPQDVTDLRPSADGPVQATVTPAGCTRPVLELFPPGRRFSGPQLSELVAGTCSNVGFSANDVMTVSSDGKTWYVKMERTASTPAGEYVVKWVKTEADYLDTFGH